MRAEEVRKSSGRNRVADEMSKLFHRKKAKPTTSTKRNTWTHSFVCLSYCDQTAIPTTAAEKDSIIIIFIISSSKTMVTSDGNGI